MNNDRRTAAIQLRLAKAHLILQEVPMLIQYKYHSTAITRMYYACLNATRSLLLTKNLISKTHKGVLNMLHEHFVKAGEFDKQMADFFGKLLHQRILIDYGEELPDEREDITDYFNSTKQYIELIESRIKTE